MSVSDAADRTGHVTMSVVAQIHLEVPQLVEVRQADVDVHEIDAVHQQLLQSVVRRQVQSFVSIRVYPDASRQIKLG